MTDSNRIRLTAPARWSSAPPRAAAALPLLLLLALVALCFAYAHIGRRLPRGLPPPAPRPPAPAWSAPALLPPAAWSVVRPVRGAPAAGTGALAQRLRLAGTFFVSGGDGARVGRAILDDLQEKRQVLVGEGDAVGDVRVWRILADRVIVTFEGRDEELRLAFRDGGGPAAAATESAPAPSAGGPEGEDPPALEVSRFGRRVGEDRWVLQRDAMLGYYREMLDNPERVGRLYASFKPLRNETGGISGYHLGIEGEEDFLRDMGLREGDRVRAVNSLQMTSQSRAEYFIGEFVKGDLSAIVVDLERDGAPRKLVYLVR